MYGEDDYNGVTSFDEEIVWTLQPSQMLAFNHWFLGVLFFVMGVSQGFLFLGEISYYLGYPLSAAWLLLSFLFFIPAIHQTLKLKCTLYELTTEHLKIKSGILSTQIDEVELHRVRDYKVTQPLDLRLFRLGNLRVESSDRSIPIVYLKGIKDTDKYRDIMRKQVEARKRAVGFSEHEVT